MNIRQLQTFTWAARLGSFARAAQQLNATQSAVSMRIQEVESRLGVVLFDRSQRKAQPTPEGAMLLPLAEDVLNAFERFVNAAAPNQRQISGLVRLGVTENVAVTWLGAMLKTLKADHPMLQIELEVGISHVLEEKLYARSLDMALAACDLPASKFHSTLLQSIDFRWMCSPSLEDVPDVLSSESFSELPILAVTREWQASGSMLRWFADNNIHYRNVTICNTFRTTASLAMDGLGLAQLPVDVFRKEVGQGQLRVLRSHPELPPLHIFAIRPAGQVSALYSVIENASRVAAAGAAEVLPPL